MSFILFVLSIALAQSTAGTKLDLSWRGLRKEFFNNKNSSVIDQIDEATELNLQGNLLDSFLDCSARLGNLEILDLSQNQLQRFFFLCKEEDNLYKLNVSHNHISFLNETQALTERVNKLEILDLSFNLLENVGRNTFQHLEKLRILKLNANPIGNNIHEGSFRNLSSLVDLDLSNISAARFPADLFTPLLNLRYISLASNPLVAVPALPAGIQSLDISRTNIIKLEYMDYPNLMTLFMRSMPLLETLDFNQIAKLRNLTVLSIDNSLALKGLTFQPRREDILPNLREISLKNCSVGEIADELLPVMRNIVAIDLQNNPWQCECGLKWILTVDSTKNYRDDMRCASPDELRGKRVFELSPDDFGCRRLLHLSLWFGLGVLVSIVVFGTIGYLARKPLRQWSVRPRSGNTVIYRNMTTNPNDSEKILDQCDITDYH